MDFCSLGITDTSWEDKGQFGFYTGNGLFNYVLNNITLFGTGLNVQILFGSHDVPWLQSPSRAFPYYTSLKFDFGLEC